MFADSIYFMQFLSNEKLILQKIINFVNLIEFVK